jgi:predicted metal-dependent hydrolase
MAKKYSTPLLDNAAQRLAAASIELQVTKKHVKNINFRLTPHALRVSVPMSISAAQMVTAINKRLPWALDNHPQVLAQHNQKQTPLLNSATIATPISLWGTAQSLLLTEEDKIAYYRQQLATVTPALFAKWQPIVGAKANEIRLKKMHTRWGSCNTRARRIWLSVYLPAYPIECTEYVIVHELCHLHHANHSRAFWQSVATAMPDYQQWHDMLAGKSGQLD